ncbi:EI24 domain-containing protein [Desulfogranum japonicum]|uniref:EI24 domain-containing protein n=1 Tax=Desulfogranum japonicum TaxID=231447 RepID=UPI0005537A65|nr:EI24 domain-containing protein [Desulfogranum japonicum]
MVSTTSVSKKKAPWISLGYSAGFIFRYPKLMSVSILLIGLTALLTWVGAHFTLGLVDSYTGNFFVQPPVADHFWKYPLVWGWYVLDWVFLFISRIIVFYLAFLLAYSLTSPGYAFLSILAGNRFTGKVREGEAVMSLTGFLVDMWEGIKIGFVGVLATVLALVVNFIPVIGQVSVFLIYVYYSTLMFIDFPSSRYRWSLGKKIGWIGTNRTASFRLGLFPALLSMIPLVNIFFMALFFPLFTVYGTLNYLTIEGRT